ncbi:helix-turn-helix domain-containing protein [Nonomuraea sp. NPDC005983]|uniref:helix-turn-helix domain-containing protein n=1 Tax=Nonomuraea sp. NPDC005983 TaxID=3155595 RepID=UPI0033B22FA4
MRTAQQLFATEGLGVSLDEIARRAGVGPGTVHRHFPAKESGDPWSCSRAILTPSSPPRECAIDLRGQAVRQIQPCSAAMRAASCLFEAPSFAMAAAR